MGSQREGSRVPGKTRVFAPVEKTSGRVTSDSVATRLDDLKALTDSALTQLKLEDLLQELLIRTRVILDCDTAAVLTLDGASDELVARAACGIEEEVRQGVRVPLGRGFAGRIAATGDAVRLNHVNASTVSNPILWEKGIEVMVGVPLLGADERVLGVLHVGRLEARPFTDDDIDLLRVVSDRVASAIQLHHFAIDRAIAGELERSLLPAKLPQLQGIQFAARYVAAETNNVGGDWYDVFTLPSGQLWVVMGDVAGHGLQAAVVMGRIRSALRAYTMLEASSPAQVLDLVDRKVNHFEIDTIATVACAALDPPYETMTLALAGHLPPLVTPADQEPFFPDTVPSPPIGTRVAMERHSTKVALPPESTVAFYTDGLVERRGESLDVGMARLRNALEHGPPERVAGDIMRRVVGDFVPPDDIALVVMQRTRSDQD